MEKDIKQIPGRVNDHSSFVEWTRHINHRTAKRLTLRFAVEHVYAVIQYRDVKTGEIYKTPVVAMPSGDSFIIPLPNEEETGWYQSVLESGICRLEWHGRMYTLHEPQVIEPHEALPLFPGWVRYLLRRTTGFLKLACLSGPEPLAGQKIRKILVYGAGVLGSLYAGKLSQAGYDVTLLARGKRLQELNENGLLLEKNGSNTVECISVKVTDRLAPEDAYDLVLVVVRKNQVASVLPVLVANTHTPNVLFMVNTAEGSVMLVEALGRSRVLLGFPGAGGQRSEGIVHYRLTSALIQPTTIAELDGSQSERMAQITRALTDAGFPVAISKNMDAWLKTHVALVSPIGNALSLAGGNIYHLARTRDGLVLMIRAIKEGLRVLRVLGIPVTPARYRLIPWLPEPFLVGILQKVFATSQAELALARHANAARDEMVILAEEYRALARRSGVATPAMDTLYDYLDPDKPPMAEGQANLKMDWRSTFVIAGVLAALGGLLAWLLARRRK